MSHSSPDPASAFVGRWWLCHTSHQCATSSFKAPANTPPPGPQCTKLKRALDEPDCDCAYSKWWHHDSQSQEEAGATHNECWGIGDAPAQQGCSNLSSLTSDYARGRVQQPQQSHHSCRTRVERKALRARRFGANSLISRSPLLPPSHPALLGTCLGQQRLPGAG